MKIPPWFVAVAAASLFCLGFASARQPSHTAPAQDEKHAESEQEAKERKVREFLVSIHSREAAEKGVKQMLQAFDAMPGLPEGFGAAFRDRFDLDHLQELMIPVYVERLDVSTLDAALQFNGTKEGQRLCETMVDIQIECMKIGQEYGAEIGREVGEELAGK